MDFCIQGLVNKRTTGEQETKGQKWQAKPDTWEENFKIKQEITEPNSQTMKPGRALLMFLQMLLHKSNLHV